VRFRGSAVADEGLSRAYVGLLMLA